MKLVCRVMGHRWQFWCDGATLRWRCARGCEELGGAREYRDEREARRYLSRFGRAPRPPLGLLAALSGTVVRGQHGVGSAAAPQRRRHPPASS